MINVMTVGESGIALMPGILSFLGLHYFYPGFSTADITVLKHFKLLPVTHLPHQGVAWQM